MRAPVLALCLFAAACGERLAAPSVLVTLAKGDLEVAPGQSLQDAVDAAPDGSVVTLHAGRHRGPVRVDRGIALQGPREAVIDGGGTGTTVSLRGRGSSLRGCTLTCGGQRLDAQDGAVHAEGEDQVVEDVHIEGSLFGVLVHASKRATVRNCVVLGDAREALGMRGDGIRLWETHDSVVEGNTVLDHRDVVVWYSSHNRVTGNRVEHCRYGTHFMFSHENVVEDNVYVDDVVGVFVMYSHDLALRRNVMARASGAAGIGLGLKESGNLLVEHNWFVQNTTGIYVDASPLDPSHNDRFEHNVIRLCDTAIHLHAKAPRNEFRRNVLADNGTVIQVGGDGDALLCTFDENSFDTYQGYDLDGDGHGDVPFEFRRLSSQLVSRHEDLALLAGSPAMALVDLTGELLPLFQPRTLLRDERPLVRAPQPTFVPLLQEQLDHAR